MEIIGRRDENQRNVSSVKSPVLAQVHAAVIATGASAADGAWRFPLVDPEVQPSSDAIVARWNRANDGQALARLEEHLVRRIRQ